MRLRQRDCYRPTRIQALRCWSKKYMSLRRIETYVLGAAVVACGVLDANARGSVSSSAAIVVAEVARGKLSPAASQPGDMIVLKLKNDLKSNGKVLLTKGSSISGFVRAVKSDTNAGADNAEVRGQFRSMIEIEWIAPVSQGKAPQNLSIALQSVVQVNSPAAATSALGAVDSFTPAAASQPLRASSQANAALLSMPFVVALDPQTSSAIDARLGKPSSGPWYRIGRGQLTATGPRQFLEIFSHLNNDTVIASANQSFEISSGAQMHLLVGVNRN